MLNLRKIILIVSLCIFNLLDSIQASNNLQQNVQQPVWMNAGDFSNNKKKIIAQQIINSDRLDFRIGDVNTPGKIAYKHAGFNVGGGRRSNLNSYLIMPAYGVADFHTLITNVIQNGVVGADRDPKRFSITATCQNNCQAWGLTNNNFAGYFVRDNPAGQQLIQKNTITVVFSVINMDQNIYGNITQNQQFENLVQQQNTTANNHRGEYAGDIITILLP